MPRRRKATARWATGWTKNEDTAYAFVLADIKARQWVFKPENKEKTFETMEKLGYKITPAFKASYKESLEQISPDGGFANAAVHGPVPVSGSRNGQDPEELRLAQGRRHEIRVGGAEGARPAAASGQALILKQDRMH